MSVIGSNILAGASGQAGYFLTKSLRFRSSASAYLNRTYGTATTQNTFTLSFWMKRGKLSSFQTTFGATNVNFDGLSINSSDQIVIYANNTAALTTTAVYRDPSAWYHIVLSHSNTSNTLYVNGISAGTGTFSLTIINTAISHAIGQNGGGNYFDGYLAEVNFIDGQALTPSSFGETSTTTGVWQPKKYTGTYGTNGFYLPFTDTTSTSTLGTDFSGNSNTWTVNNISLTAGSTYDSMNDVPTLTSATTANYSVLNPLDIPSNISVSNGNLEASISTTAVWKTICNTISVSSGKWYAEFSTNNTVSMAGIIRSSWNANIADSRFWLDSLGYGYYSDTGAKYNNSTGTSYGAAYTTNDIIGVALDLDNGTLVFYKNGVSQGTAFTGLTGEFKFAVAIYYSPQVAIANFGQRPFSYTPPTGFVALNTFNLPTPTIGATASSQADNYFNAVTYTGTSGTQAVTGVGFQPDFVWIKNRTSTLSHVLQDAVRGTTAYLVSNATTAENTNTASNWFRSFDSDGFTVATLTSPGGVSTNEWNNTGYNYVSWNWRASNTTAVTNTAGSITSTVSANTTAGFSIVTYTGTGSAGTVGHGLGVAPAMFITKQRSAVGDFFTYHKSVGATAGLFLNLTTAATTNTYFNNTAPTSSVFSIGTASGLNANGVTAVTYCFAEVAGYSAFGSYTGNGSTDGTFVYLGFRPKFVMVKSTSGSRNWAILDASRNPSNVANFDLYPNQSLAEVTQSTLDFLSNGFKLRVTDSDFNAAETYIYMAFAENPFKYSNAR